MTLGDLEGLALCLDRLLFIEAAAYHREPEPWIECIVADDRLGPRLLLVIALHQTGVAEVIPASDGEHRAATLK